MRWRIKQKQGALFKREKWFAIISLANPKQKFVELYGNGSRNFTILKSQESEPNGNKARELELQSESN